MLRLAACLLLSIALAPAVAADPAVEIAGGSSRSLPPHCEWIAVEPLAPAADAEPGCLLPGQGGSCSSRDLILRGVEVRFLATNVC